MLSDAANLMTGKFPAFSESGEKLEGSSESRTDGRGRDKSTTFKRVLLLKL